MQELIGSNNKENLFSLGVGLLIKKEDSSVELWRNGALLFRKELDTRGKSPEFRLLIVELCQDYKAQKTKLAQVFPVSRRSIDDWIVSYNKHGVKGLINSTKKSPHFYRTNENKSKSNTTERQVKQLKINELQLKIEDVTLPIIPKTDSEDAVYGQVSQKAENRYAGVFIMQILLASEFAWFNWIIGLYGDAYKIFQIFSLMFAKNIRSIEQLKNIRSREAGIILGIKKLPSLPGIWNMFYKASEKKLSEVLKRYFFVWQISVAQVSSRFWFTDGHFLPYTGKEKMHKVFNTKQREVQPGSISFVTCDFVGKVVDFQLKEGGSGLREHILNLHNKWSDNFDKKDFPVHIFDREGDGCEFFYNLVKRDCPFITWEKNANRRKLYDTDETNFDKVLEFNKIKYLYYEDNKHFTYKDEQAEEHKFSLRRFWIINTASKKRTSALAFSGATDLSQNECIEGVLNRWGASENTFKHLGSRHPQAYRPGFKLLRSNNQTIINPEIKILDKQIKLKEKEYTKECKIIATKEKSITKDGKERKNGIYSKLKSKIKNITAEKQELKEQKKQLPDRIDISELTNYKDFKEHHNEGKNIFDFVKSISWNARKKGGEILDNFYHNKNDLVDLFYAITDCAGTVEITPSYIKVVLEPLEQSSRRIAQTEFCRKLTQRGAITPGHKKMIIQVKKI